MNKLSWTTTNRISMGRHDIPCSENLHDQRYQAAGIRRASMPKLIVKRILWPAFKLRNDLFVDGFIERDIGRWIKEFVTDNTVFLEIGCGDMSLNRFLPKSICYNAFDLALSEFHLRRILENRNNVNVALASATNIPLESNSVSLIVATQCFEYIQEIDCAMDEIHRVATPGAKLICSISNNYCYKYQKKGPNPGHVNNWTYDGFKEFMTSHNFKFLKGYRKGLWIPLPLWLTNISYQLPISSNNEFYNTNFFYVFHRI